MYSKEYKALEGFTAYYNAVFVETGLPPVFLFFENQICTDGGHVGTIAKK